MTHFTVIALGCSVQLSFVHTQSSITELPMQCNHLKSMVDLKDKRNRLISGLCNIHVRLLMIELSAALCHHIWPTTYHHHPFLFHDNRVETSSIIVKLLFVVFVELLMQVLW